MDVETEQEEGVPPHRHAASATLERQSGFASDELRKQTHDPKSDPIYGDCPASFLRTQSPGH